MDDTTPWLRLTQWSETFCGKTLAVRKDHGALLAVADDFSSVLVDQLHSSFASHKRQDPGPRDHQGGQAPNGERGHRQTPSMGSNHADHPHTGIQHVAPVAQGLSRRYPPPFHLHQELSSRYPPPFHLLQESTTVKRYVNHWKHFFYVLRTSSLDRFVRDKTYGIRLTEDRLVILREQLNTLDEYDDEEDEDEHQFKQENDDIEKEDEDFIYMIWMKKTESMKT